MGIFSTSVVAKMNLTCAGGSSRVLQQGVERLLGEHVDFVDDVDLEARSGAGGYWTLLRTSRMLSMPRLLAAVDLQHVHVLAAGDGATDFALARTARASAP